VLAQQYAEAFDAGHLLPHEAFLLAQSVETALEHTRTGLQDWALIKMRLCPLEQIGHPRSVQKTARLVWLAPC
jgi:hypothetical protein